MYTDSKQRTWRILERENGSVSIYYTTEDSPAHYVIFDTLDAEKKNNAEKIEQQYIGVCSLLAKLYGHVEHDVEGNLDYLWTIDRALNDFQAVLGNRFEVLRKIKTDAPYAVEPRRIGK